MLSKDQLIRLREDGYLAVKGVLPVELVAGWLEGWHQLQEDIGAGRSSVKRSDRFVVGTLPPPLADVYAHPSLVSIANSMLGPDVALYFLRLLVKDVTWNGIVTAHQDMPYFHGGQEKLSVFVPLTPLTQEVGALNFVAGSNRFGNLGIRGTIDYVKFPDLRIATPELVPGDVVLADFHVWHYSEAATVPAERPVVQIAYQPAKDGSYLGMPDRPVLVTGSWRTTHFVKFGEGIIPDTVLPAQTVSPSEQPPDETPSARGRGLLATLVKMLGR